MAVLFPSSMSYLWWLPHPKSHELHFFFPLQPAFFFLFVYFHECSVYEEKSHHF